MKNKKGFISVSIIYSFFLVFLLIMLAMLADYLNKRYILETEPPGDAICEADSKLPKCIRKIQDLKGTYYKETPPTSGCVEKKGLYQTKGDGNVDTDVFAGATNDNYVLFGGYYWRIVRINGDQTVRLLYSGQDINGDRKLDYNEDANKNGKLDSGEDKNGNGKLDIEMPYIISKNNAGDDVVRTRYNYSVLADTGCNDTTVGWYKQYVDDVKALEKFEEQVVECASAESVEDACNTRCNPDDMTSGWGGRLLNDFKNNICSVGCKTVLEASHTLKRAVRLEINCSESSINSERQRLESNLKTTKEKYEHWCIQPVIADDQNNTVLGAYLPNRIGYMNNTSANILRYDSKYDNQDDSEIKKYIDTWYENSIASLGGNLSVSTIFCGDKSSNDNLDGKVDVSGVKYGRSSKIKSNNPDLKCANTGGGHVFTGDYFYTSGLDLSGIRNEWWIKWAFDANLLRSCYPITTYERLLAVGNNVVNLSRYNVNNNSNATINGHSNPVRVYKFEDNDLGVDNNCVRKTSSSKYIVASGTKLSDKLAIRRELNNSASGALNAMYATTSWPTISGNKIVGNGDLKYPIALLSADEAEMAGVRYSNVHNEKKLFKKEGFNDPTTGKYNDETKCKSYIMDEMSNTPDAYSNGFWTMTLSETGFTDDSGFGAAYFAVISIKGRVWIEDIRDRKTADDGLFMRPVINIKEDVPYCMHWDRGNVGTIENPIEIGVSC